VGACKVLCRQYRYYEGSDRVIEMLERECPFCRSDVPIEAQVCKHCSRDIPAVSNNELMFKRGAFILFALFCLYSVYCK
jgi:hypothetical protein